MENVEYGNGIRNIEARSKNIGGKLKWKSSAESGTMIKFIGEIKNTNPLKKIIKSIFIINQI